MTDDREGALSDWEAEGVVQPTRRWWVGKRRRGGGREKEKKTGELAEGVTHTHRHVHSCALQGCLR